MLAPYIARVSALAFETDLRFAGNQAQLKAARDDLVATRDVVLAFDFFLAVLCWYEENRIDRKELFVLRLTPELRHDILPYLVARQTDPKAVYLILESLFIHTSRA